MNWKIGQKLVSLKNQKELTRYGIGPIKGEVVTYDGHCPDGYVYLKEYNILNANGIRFAVGERTVQPTLGQSVKSELVSSFTEVTETSDLPIRSPQPVPSSCGS